MSLYELPVAPPVTFIEVPPQVIYEMPLPLDQRRPLVTREPITCLIHGDKWKDKIQNLISQLQKCLLPTEEAFRPALLQGLCSCGKKTRSSTRGFFCKMENLPASFYEEKLQAKVIHILNFINTRNSLSPVVIGQLTSILTDIHRISGVPHREAFVSILHSYIFKPYRRITKIALELQPNNVEGLAVTFSKWLIDVCRMQSCTMKIVGLEKVDDMYTCMIHVSCASFASFNQIENQMRKHCKNTRTTATETSNIERSDGDIEDIFQDAVELLFGDPEQKGEPEKQEAGLVQCFFGAPYESLEDSETKTQNEQSWLSQRLESDVDKGIQNLEIRIQKLQSLSLQKLQANIDNENLKILSKNIGSVVLQNLKSDLGDDNLSDSLSKREVLKELLVNTS